MSAVYCQYCGGVLWGTTALSTAHPCVCGQVLSSSSNRWKKRYGITYCSICEFPAEYCKGHPTPDTPAQDGETTQLAQHIAELRMKAGGR